jgi:uncharacterized OB-fold protein
MRRSVPEPTQTSAPFWAATREKRLEIQFCESCGAWVWYPRGACPCCLDDALVWRPLSGRGVVYAISTHHRASIPELADRTPYVVALVDLVEGVRMLSNIVGSGAEGACVGSMVTVTWERLDDGRRLPLFEVAVDG